MLGRRIPAPGHFSGHAPPNPPCCGIHFVAGDAWVAAGIVPIARPPVQAARRPTLGPPANKFGPHEICHRPQLRALAYQAAHCMASSSAELGALTAIAARGRGNLLDRSGHSNLGLECGEKLRDESYAWCRIDSKLRWIDHSNNSAKRLKVVGARFWGLQRCSPPASREDCGPRNATQHQDNII